MRGQSSQQGQGATGTVCLCKFSAVLECNQMANSSFGNVVLCCNNLKVFCLLSLVHFCDPCVLSLATNQISSGIIVKPAVCNLGFSPSGSKSNYTNTDDVLTTP